MKTVLPDPLFAGFPGIFKGVLEKCGVFGWFFAGEFVVECGRVLVLISW